MRPAAGNRDRNRGGRANKREAMPPLMPLLQHSHWLQHSFGASQLAEEPRSQEARQLVGRAASSSAPQQRRQTSQRREFRRRRLRRRDRCCCRRRHWLPAVGSCQREVSSVGLVWSRSLDLLWRRQQLQQTNCSPASQPTAATLFALERDESTRLGEARA